MFFDAVDCYKTKNISFSHHVATYKVSYIYKSMFIYKLTNLSCKIGINNCTANIYSIKLNIISKTTKQLTYNLIWKLQTTLFLFFTNLIYLPNKIYHFLYNNYMFFFKNLLIWLLCHWLILTESNFTNQS